MTSTLPTWNLHHSPRRDAGQNIAVWILAGVIAGTGGSVTGDKAIKHFGTGSPLRALTGSTARAATQGFAVELQLIRETLRLSVAEIARLFGVTRPTIYSWQNGATASPENAQRLQEIVHALDLHKDIITPEGGRVAHRAIDGRTTLLQMLAQGANAQDAISRLAGILTNEAAQRDRLARRLHGRTRNLGEADVDTFG